jgi:hypothetical protein
MDEQQREPILAEVLRRNGREDEFHQAFRKVWKALAG